MLHSLAWAFSTSRLRRRLWGWRWCSATALRPRTRRESFKVSLLHGTCVCVLGDVVEETLWSVVLLCAPRCVCNCEGQREKVQGAEGRTRRSAVQQCLSCLRLQQILRRCVVAFTSSFTRRDETETRDHGRGSALLDLCCVVVEAARATTTTARISTLRRGQQAEAALPGAPRGSAGRAHDATWQHST